jgi:hypothetical protein
MNVRIAVGMRVVVTMMSRPPQRTLLIRRATDESQEKLKATVCFIRAMREVPVITSRHSKDTQTIKRNTRRNGNPAHASPKEKQTASVQDDKLS